MFDSIRDGVAMCLALAAEGLHAIAGVISPEVHGDPSPFGQDDYDWALRLIRSADPIPQGGHYADPSDV